MNYFCDPMSDLIKTPPFRHVITQMKHFASSAFSYPEIVTGSGSTGHAVKREMPLMHARPVNKPTNSEASQVQKALEMTFSRNAHRAVVGKAPHSVARRNARERRRVQAVNHAFARLRRTLPTSQQKGKRISKVKTLRLAISYIDNLSKTLNETRSNQQADCHPLCTHFVPQYCHCIEITGSDHELQGDRCAYGTSFAQMQLQNDPMELNDPGQNQVDLNNPYGHVGHLPP